MEKLRPPHQHQRERAAGGDGEREKLGGSGRTHPRARDDEGHAEHRRDDHADGVLGIRDRRGNQRERRARERDDGGRHHRATFDTSAGALTEHGQQQEGGGEGERIQLDGLDALGEEL